MWKYFGELTRNWILWDRIFENIHIERWVCIRTMRMKRVALGY